MVIVGFLSGWLLSWPIAGERGEIRARVDWLYFLAPFLTFPLYWYFLNEGSDGKVGYSYPGGATSIDQIIKLTFPGYPDPKKSPYSLPYEDGTSAECVQGNHGLFSHNAIGTTVQLFAYDFSLPYGTEILAMRDGKVVGGMYTADPIEDGTENDSATQSGANMVTLRHKTTDDQDIDADGTTKQTYATYLHGAKGTITKAVKDALAGGAVVKMGTAIMHVDSTGVSRLNHVHVDIRPDDGHGRPNTHTIPFVFSEVGGDGVPTSQHYYESRM
jgi:murein DD-endopeptidase MepM/ murein hydrolase activator NlpD